MRLRLFCLTALLATGCNSVSLTDDIDLVLDFTPLMGPSDALHQPYVQGAQMTIYVHSSDSRTSMSDWTVESLNPEIFTVSNMSHDPQHNTFSFAGQALTAGTAMIAIYDGNHNAQSHHPIVVALPDRVELLAHGLLLIGKSESEASATELRIRAGGTATYLARYYQGEQQLYGNGALSAVAPSGVTPHVAHTFLLENRDWLQLSPSQSGNFMVALSTGGTHVADAPIVSVPDSDAQRVQILGVDESKAHKDDWLVALAQAFDGSERAIYGVDYAWTLDGLTQGNLLEMTVGDLYRYQYDPKTPHMLSASFNGMNADTMIHGAGFVDSTNHVGCSTAPGRPAESAAWFVGFVALMASAFAARRRRH
jgi:MYXO-CTERM domain-containing protein